MNIKDKSTVTNFLFHEVSEEVLMSGFNNKNNIAYTHTPEQFLEMMNEMNNQNKFSNLPVDLLNFDDEDGGVLVTFDDGGISAMLSADILEKFGTIGHFFITTKQINSPGFMTDENIVSLIKRKHHIGSHSHSHPMIFRSLSFDKMKEEWSTSKKILEEITGKEVVSCSIPGGDADEKTYESAIECGYKYIFNSEPDSRVRQIGDAFIFGRFSVKNTTSLQSIKKIIEGSNHKNLQNKRLIKNTIKKMIFPLHQYIQNKKNC